MIEPSLTSSTQSADIKALQQACETSITQTKAALEALLIELNTQSSLLTRCAITWEKQHLIEKIIFGLLLFCLPLPLHAIGLIIGLVLLIAYVVCDQLLVNHAQQQQSYKQQITLTNELMMSVFTLFHSCITELRGLIKELDKVSVELNASLAQQQSLQDNLTATTATFTEQIHQHKQQLVELQTLNSGLLESMAVLHKIIADTNIKEAFTDHLNEMQALTKRYTTQLEELEKATQQIKQCTTPLRANINRFPQIWWSSIADNESDKPFSGLVVSL